MNLPTCSTWQFIDTSGAEDLLRSLKGERAALHVEHVIQFDAVLEALNDGALLSTIVQKATRQLERYIIVNVLAFTDGNKSEAARVLKINYKTLYYKIKKYSI